MKKKSLITMVAAVCLTGVVMVGATLAYLTSTTGVAENTFTVGKVEIVLDEKTGAETGDLESESDWNDDVDGKNMYPGQIVDKRPVVTVKADSADCFVFVKVTGADALKEQDVIIDGWDSDEWVKTDSLDSLDGIYRYIGSVADADDIVIKSNNDQFLSPIFLKVKYQESAEGSSSSSLGSVKVVAAAIQAEGIDKATALEEATSLLTNALPEMD